MDEDLKIFLAALAITGLMWLVGSGIIEIWKAINHMLGIG